MPNNSDSNVNSADALTLLRHNQHALGAAIEEITSCISRSGADTVADNAVAALETLERNAQSFIEAILLHRNS
jgi:hypothetical protein